MKKILLCILIIVLCLVISACGYGSNEYKTEKDYEAQKIVHFKKLYSNIDVGMGSNTDDVYVDQNTGVLYYRWYIGYRGGITPIYNSDGTLKIWEDFKK